MTLTECEHVQAKAIVKGPEPRAGNDEKRELFMAALPMLIVFVMWLVAQVWLMAPLIWR